MDKESKKMELIGKLSSPHMFMQLLFENIKSQNYP